MLSQAFADLKKKIIAGTSFEHHAASDTNSSGTSSHGKTCFSDIYHLKFCVKLIRSQLNM